MKTTGEIILFSVNVMCATGLLAILLAALYPVFRYLAWPLWRLTAFSRPLDAAGRYLYCFCAYLFWLTFGFLEWPFRAYRKNRKWLKKDSRYPSERIY